MDGYYEQLVVAANEYIDAMSKAGGLLSIVLFGTNARVLYEQKTQNMRATDRENGNTDYCRALSLAIPVAKRTPSQYQARILFFTDGRPGLFPESEVEQLQWEELRLDAIGFGSIDKSTLQRLVTGGGTVEIGRTITEVREIFRRKAATNILVASGAGKP
jgi:Mg-chelatase subunit ChlD